MEFYLYKQGGKITYSAKYVFEKDNKLYLIDSNKPVLIEDIADNDLINNLFYSMIIIIKDTNTVLAKYGELGYCHSLYYIFEDSNNFYLDLHLKNLIKVKQNPILDKVAVNKFILQGFLTSKETLIDGINRLQPLKSFINGKIIGSKYLNRAYFSKNYSEALSLDLKDLDNVILALSGGYDSTLLAYLLKDKQNKLAITVGKDTYDKTEIYIAQKTALLLNYSYSIVNLPDNWIDILPKIVEMFEGELMDPGLFVRFAVLSKIKELKKDDWTLVTGDGANQLRNSYFYFITDLEKSMSKPSRLDLLRTNPRAFFFGVVTKQIEWIAHESNLNYVIPYLSSEFYNYSKNNQMIDYKKYVLDLLPQALGSNIVEQGGLIDESNFLPKETLLLFRKVIQKEDIFDKRIEKIYNPNIRVLINQIYILLFNEIFIKNHQSPVDLVSWLSDKVYEEI